MKYDFLPSQDSDMEVKENSISYKAIHLLSQLFAVINGFVALVRSVLVQRQTRDPPTPTL